MATTARKTITTILLALIAASMAFAAPPAGGDAPDTPGNSISSTTLEIQPILIGNKASSEGVVTENPFSGAWGFYLTIIVGALGGTLMIFRFAIELVGAIIFDSESSNASTRKAITRFLVHIGLVAIAIAMPTLVGLIL